MANLDFSEIAKLNERYNKDPKSKIFVQLADAYRKNDMFDEALDVLNKGLQYHPHYPVAYLIQGKCYFAKRIFAQAKESFEQVISLDPQNIVALRMLAQTCEALKDETCQISAYKGIIAVDPLDTATKEKLEQLERTQKKDTLYTITMAQEYENQQNYSQALSIYEYLLVTDPTDLVLQQKVKELRSKVGKEEKKIEEEKIEGLQLESYFTAEDFKQKEETTTSEPPGPTMGQESAPPVYTERPTEQKESPSPPRPEQIKPESVTEEKKAEEDILSLEDFLAEETTAQSTEPLDEKKIPPKQETEEFEQLFTEAEKAEIEGVTSGTQSPTEMKPPEEPPTTEKIEEPMKTREIEKTEEPEKTEKIKEEPKPDIQVQKPKPAEEKKTKEEDFQSFKDWLSGLLK